MDRFDSYDFYNSDALRRESRLDRDIERSAVGRRQTVVTLIEKDVCPHAGPNLDHAALKADPVAFAALEQRGPMPTYDEPGQPQTVLLANCTVCHSTIARVVTT